MNSVEPRYITPEQAERILTERVRTDFRSFLRKTFATVSPGVPLVWNWHLDAMCDYLEALQRGEFRRLVINIPPRTTKSVTCSVAFPAWLLGHNPAEQIVGASFKEELSVKMNVDTRLVMQSEWYRSAFPDVEMAADQNQKWKYQTTKRGHRIATTVNSGAILGEGGNYLILDDPLNPEQAASDTERKNANTWVRQTFFSRFNDKRIGKFLLVMQRLHEDDVTGHLLEDKGYTHLCLPAEFTKKVVIENPLKHLDARRQDWVKEEGDLLDPLRLGRPELDQAFKDMGEYIYAGQMMQQPAPAEGGLVKMGWFKRYVDRPFTFQAIIHSWDTAIKANAGSDYSACTIWGVAHNGYYLLDVVMEKMEYPDLKKKVIELYQRDKPHMILVEDKASGQSLIQDLAANMRIPLTGITPHKDKIQRLSACSILIEGGNVYLPTAAPWLESFEQQVKFFPNARHDDVVDSLSQFLNWIKNRFDFHSDNMDNAFDDDEGYERDNFLGAGRNPVTGY